MGANISKLRCLYLPAQSGKTRKAEELIRDFKRREKVFDEESIDIWISANNKLLVAQTNSRLKKDLGGAHSEDSESESESESESDARESNAVIKEDIFSWTSGTKASNLPVAELAWRLVDDTVGMIIVCAHKRRLDYIAELLRRLSKPKTKFTKKINIWIDEADYSTRLWMKHTAIADLPLVNHITLVSATFGEVFKHYDSLKVIPYGEGEVMPSVYRRLKDCKLVVEGTGRESAGDYVDAVLAKYPALMAPGMRAFIPGNIGKASHEDISARLLEKGFVVLILNGDHKEIRFPNEEDETIDLRPFLTVSDPEKTPDEFNKNLAKLYVTHRLHRFPLAITGFLCVERGITFQSAPAEESSRSEFVFDHNGFLFDYAIVSSIKDKAEAYQAMARVFGNIGGYNGSRVCTIYSDAKTFDKVREQEETAVHTARLVAERLKRDPEASTEVSLDDLEIASRWEDEQRWIIHLNEYETLEEAESLIRDEYGIYRKKEQDTDEDGYYINPVFGATELGTEPLLYDDLMARLERTPKTSLFNAYRDLKKARRIQAARLFVAYTDLEDPASAVFVVRALEKKKKRLIRK